MKLIEVVVQTDGEAAEAVSAVFNQHSKGGAVLEEVWSSAPRSPRVRVKAFLMPDEGCALRRIEEALWYLGRIYPIASPEVRWLEEEEWAGAWKAGYKTLRIGSRIVIRPSWLAFDGKPDQVVIELDPGMAFGTGLHPSTRLAVLAEERQIRPGDHVLDVGTGSGILAILAAKLGAGNVVGLDIDALALDVARQNAVRNGVQDKVSLLQASLVPHQAGSGCGHPVELFDSFGQWSGTFDLVLMNILADVIIRSATAIAACLADGGRFVVSGVIQSQEHATRKALEDARLRITRSRRRKDWRALTGQKAQHGGAR